MRSWYGALAACGPPGQGALRLTVKARAFFSSTHTGAIKARGPSAIAWGTWGVLGMQASASKLLNF